TQLFEDFKTGNRWPRSRVVRMGSPPVTCSCGLAHRFSLWLDSQITKLHPQIPSVDRIYQAYKVGRTGARSQASSDFWCTISFHQRSVIIGISLRIWLEPSAATCKTEEVIVDHAKPYSFNSLLFRGLVLQSERGNEARGFPPGSYLGARVEPA